MYFFNGNVFMTNYDIIENKNNIKSKERFYKDSYLNQLIGIVVNYKGSFKIHNLVRDLFYLKTMDEYEELLTKYLRIYELHHEIIYRIYNLFTNWLPFEIYNLGQLRGNYLELLSYKYLKQSYPSLKIHMESNILVNDFKSHTWDLIVELPELLQLYECKFSPNSIKRHHINQMIALKNKLPNSSLFLVFYDINEWVTFNIKKLREDTQKDKYDDIIDNFTFITLDKFIL